MTNILIIEDDDHINGMLAELLSPHYQVTQAFSGTEGRRLWESQGFDLLLLDLMLPGLKGEALIAHVRLTSKIPIIVITAKDDVNVLVSVLELGANDYIAKPFDTKEVLARITVQLRKVGSHQEKVTATATGIRIDSGTHQAYVNDQLLDLTNKEFELLKLLNAHPNQVFSKAKLYEMIWQEAYFGDDNTVTVHMSRLRRKLKNVNQDKEMIKTIWGVGFKLVE